MWRDVIAKNPPYSTSQSRSIFTVKIEIAGKKVLTFEQNFIIIKLSENVVSFGFHPVIKTVIFGLIKRGIGIMEQKQMYSCSALTGSELLVTINAKTVIRSPWSPPRVRVLSANLDTESGFNAGGDGQTAS